MDNYLKLRQLIAESEKLVNNQTSQLCKVIGDILSEDNQQTMDKKIFDKIKKESYNFYQILTFAKKIKTPYKSIRQEFFDVMIPFVMGIKRFFDEKHGSSYVLDFRLTMINGHDLTTPEIFDNLDEMFAWVWAEYFKYGEIPMNGKVCVFDIYCNIRDNNCAECVDVAIDYNNQDLQIAWGNEFEGYMPFYLKNYLR